MERPLPEDATKAVRLRVWPHPAPPPGDVLIAWHDPRSAPGQGALHSLIDGAVLLYEPRDVARAARNLAASRSVAALFVAQDAWNATSRSVGPVTTSRLPPLLFDRGVAGAAHHLGHAIAAQSSSHELERCWLVLVAKLARFAGGQPGAHPEPVGTRAAELARRYLLAHPGDEMTLDDLARGGGLSKHHLVHALNGLTGLPPHQLRIRMRLWRARLLLERGASPASVAQTLGFTDQSHLTTWFRRVFGVTPVAHVRASRRQFMGPFGEAHPASLGVDARKPGPAWVPIAAARAAPCLARPQTR